jgi:hypothetical protein
VRLREAAGKERVRYCVRVEVPRSSIAHMCSTSRVSLATGVRGLKLRGHAALSYKCMRP